MPASDAVRLLQLWGLCVDRGFVGSFANDVFSKEFIKVLFSLSLSIQK